jgi:hypothetical protein
VSSGDNDLGVLNSEQWQDLCNCISRLEKILQSGAAEVDLRQHLPPPGAPHRRAVLHELIKTELEVRYRRRQGCLLEEFLRRYPELGRAQELPASLVYEEYLIRTLFGERPTMDEYRARFPAQFEPFVQLIRQHSPPESLPEVAPPTHFGTIDSAGTSPSVPPSPATNSELPTAAAPKTSPPKPPTSSSSQQLVGGQGYQLLERIGRGEYGEVYRALAPGGVPVAIKRIFRSLDDEASQRELKALDKIRELRHPYLLQTQSFQAFEDRLLIVMELADGSLEDRFKECRATGLPGIPIEELLRYFTEAAEALDFLHQQKLSHRDIKPKNLLHMQGHAKVADFGIARAQINALDHTMNVGGTPAYMPPEMWHGNISVHSDQYSLALTWYEMRTGRRAICGKNQMEIAHQHLMQKQPDVSGVPPAERQVLLRALAKDPDQRFPSCAAFVQALAKTIAPPKPVVSDGGWGVRVAVIAVCLLGTALTASLVSRYIIGPPPSPIDPRPRVTWQPKGWVPEDEKNIYADSLGHSYYRRLVYNVDGQEIVVVLVPQTHDGDPPTFYAMKNKVWNDLYAVFRKDPKADQLLQKYRSCPGCDTLVRDEWRKGAFARKNLALGVDGRERLPVFRVTVTEAHCFAEWLGSRLGGHQRVLLPTRKEWLKAAGYGDDRERSGPFDGDPQDKAGLALGLEDGPWRVEQGERDVSCYGCRQMASNGFEWTRDRTDNGKEIPLDEHLLESVFYKGQSYLAHEPLTFKLMQEDRAWDCTEARFDVTFRVVVERKVEP